MTLASPDVIEYLVKCDSDSSGDYQRRCCARRSSPPDKWARTKSGGPSDRPFAARTVTMVTARRGALCSNKHKGWGPGVSKMSYHQRPHELRLAISSEAEALFSDFGGEAYAEACRRASEASSDSLARDWSVVAATIARRSGRRSSLLDALFG